MPSSTVRSSVTTSAASASAAAEIPAFVEPLVALIVDRVLARLGSAGAPAAGEAADDTPTIDQHTSPLGIRVHCAAARRRIARGEPGAAVIGRRWLLSPAAIRAEIETQTRAAARSPVRVGGGAPSRTPALDALRAEVGAQ